MRLSQEVTKEEVKATLLSLGHNKVPSLDGYPIEFFIESWDVVGNLVTKAVLDFF